MQLPRTNSLLYCEHQQLRARSLAIYYEEDAGRVTTKNSTNSLSVRKGRNFVTAFRERARFATIHADWRASESI